MEQKFRSKSFSFGIICFCCWLLVLNKEVFSQATDKTNSTIKKPKLAINFTPTDIINFGLFTGLFSSKAIYNHITIGCKYNFTQNWSIQNEVSTALNSFYINYSDILLAVELRRAINTNVEIFKPGQYVGVSFKSKFAKWKIDAFDAATISNYPKDRKYNFSTHLETYIIDLICGKETYLDKVGHLILDCYFGGGIAYNYSNTPLNESSVGIIHVNDFNYRDIYEDIHISIGVRLGYIIISK